MREYSLADLKDFGAQQLKTFGPRQLILLEGELGAGKTTLVQTMAGLLGYAAAESPTFSIINEYPTIPKIIHADLYRLETSEDIESTGFWDIFLEDSAYIFVEWASRVPAKDWPRSWPQVVWKVEKGSDPDRRKIHVS